MPVPIDPADVVDITLTDGRHLQVHTVIADRVRGIDADGDLLIPLGEGIRLDDGAEYLVPLTPCCQASGKGSTNSSTGVLCRNCYEEVDIKYGSHSTVAVARA